MEGWRKTFYSCMVAQLLAIAGFAFVFPFLPFYVRELGVHSESEVTRWTGILFSATGFTMAFVAPLWGILADRRGRKLMVLRAMYGGAVVIGLMGLATNVHHLLILRLLQGVLTGTISASVALVASVVPENRAGYALGMMQAMVFIGNSLGPFVGGLLTSMFGPRVSCFVAGLVLLVGGLFVQFGAKENFVPPAKTTSRGNPFASLFAVGAFVMALVVLFLLQFVNSLPRPGFPQFVEFLLPSRKDAELIAGLIFASNAVTAAAASHVLGRYADIWGHRRMIVGCTIIGGLMVIPQTFARNISDLAVLTILFSAAAAGITPAANLLIRRVTPKESLGKAFGVTQSITSAGFALGPLTGGYLGATLGVRPPFLISGILLTLLGIAAFWILRGTEGPATPPLDATD